MVFSSTYGCLARDRLQILLLKNRRSASVFNDVCRADRGRLFYEFRLEDRIPENHLRGRMNVFVTATLADLHKDLEPYYSDIGRTSIDPELTIRMLIVGYCYGIRSERKLYQEVELHLAYRWFCKLDLEDKVPHHSTFSENRLGRFRESDLLRHIFERVVWAVMAMGLVKGEGFAVDPSVLEANASRYHGKARSGSPSARPNSCPSATSISCSLPAPIADIAYQNKRMIYDLLFKAAAETTITIAADPKHQFLSPGSAPADLSRPEPYLTKQPC
jgi:transposase